MKQKAPFSQRSIAVLASPKFFWVIVALFVVEAAWITFTGRYPMAFDEDFHLGIIRLYAHHSSPFWGSQPPGADAFGAVARDPSYLYHYLMSFPYRLISRFTADQTIQVLWLRALNIALFATALPLYRRLLAKTGASRALVHGCLAIFVLIPIAPLLAAQINYDNLLLPLLAWALLLTLSFSDELRIRRRVNAKTLLGLLILCLLTSLVKYAFLPIFAAIIIYVVIRLKQTFPGWRALWRGLGSGLVRLTRRARWLLVIGLVIALGLFAQRDGVNIVRYHTPLASCGKVLSVQRCGAYGPWARDYQYEMGKDPHASRSPLVFTADWFYGMWLRTFFAVDGPGTRFQTHGPLLVPAIASIVFAGASLAAVATYGRRLFRRYNRPVLWLFVLVSACYVGALWLDEYSAFLKTGQAVAINGRYLLVIMPFLLLISGMAFVEWFKNRPGLRLATATIAIMSLIWGGGALTYILRSNDNWYWPNQTVRDVNHAVQKTLRPIIPGYRSPSQFL